VTYNTSFYTELAKKNDENLSKFAYWNGFAVGAICTRVEPIPERLVLEPEYTRHQCFDSIHLIHYIHHVKTYHSHTTALAEVEST
jgi:hypothetical protein